MKTVIKFHLSVQAFPLKTDFQIPAILAPLKKVNLIPSMYIGMSRCLHTSPFPALATNYRDATCVTGTLPVVAGGLLHLQGILAA